MIIEFENSNPIDEDFPNKNTEGARWYVRKQACLMFKDNSKYPDKGLVTLVFADNQNDQKSVAPFSIGKYFVQDNAFSFDSRNYDAPVCDFTQIVPINEAVIDSRVKELLSLKKSLAA